VAAPSGAERKKERAWRSLLEKWKLSGLTQAEFCRRESLKEWLFSNWKTKLAKKDAAAKPDHGRAESQRQVEFAPIRIVADEQASDSHHQKDKEQYGSTASGSVVAEIAFAGGYVRVFTGADVSMLKALLQALKE